VILHTVTDRTHHMDHGVSTGEAEIAIDLHSGNLVLRGYSKASINQKECKTSNVQNLTHLGHEHQAPDHEATQLMMGY
jgi:hypothetical protein